MQLESGGLGTISHAGSLIFRTARPIQRNSDLRHLNSGQGAVPAFDVELAKLSDEAWKVRSIKIGRCGCIW